MTFKNTGDNFNYRHHSPKSGLKKGENLKGKFILFFTAVFFFTVVFAEAGGNKEETVKSAGTEADLSSAKQLTDNVPREILSTSALPQNNTERIGFMKVRGENLPPDDLSAFRVEDAMYKYWADYSGMDAYNYEKLLAAAGINENSNISNVDLCNLAKAQCFFEGSVRRTNTGYDLRFNIQYIDGSNKGASYTGSCTEEQIENLSAMKEAALKLLADTGKLSLKAQLELPVSSQQREIAAAGARASGLNYERSGLFLNGVSSYLDAAIAEGILTPDLSSRIISLCGRVSTGGSDAQTRGNSERREEWLRILEKAEFFFDEHPPYTLKYSDYKTDDGDYYEQTISLSVNFDFLPAEGFDTIKALQNGLNAEGKRQEWGFSQWPVINTQNKNSALFSDEINYILDIQLLNEKNEIIGRSRVLFNCKSFLRNGIISGVSEKKSVIFKNIKASLFTDNEIPKFLIIRETLSSKDIQTEQDWEYWDNTPSQDVSGRKNLFISIPVTFGARFAPVGFTFNVNAGLGYKGHLFDIGVTMDSAIGDELKEIGASFSGFSFGYSYAYHIDDLFISAGIGCIIASVSNGSSSTQKFQENGFIPYLKAEADYLLRNLINLGSLSVRLGYRCELFPIKKFNSWYNEGDNKSELGDFKIRNSLYAGIAWNIF